MNKVERKMWSMIKNLEERVTKIEERAARRGIAQARGADRRASCRDDILEIFGEDHGVGKVVPASEFAELPYSKTMVQQVKLDMGIVSVKRGKDWKWLSTRGGDGVSVKSLHKVRGRGKGRK